MISTSEIVMRLLLAASLGSVIGLERERLLWAAGLRTHMLVAVGACLMMIVSAFGFTGDLGDHVTLDPSRIAAQVVSGIGFLGAGSIMLRGDKIKGLTTAASLWTVAGIGLAVGGGLYGAAIAATLIILGILAGVKPLEERFLRRYHTIELNIKARQGQISVGSINESLNASNARIRQLIIRPSAISDADEIIVTLERVALKEVANIRQILQQLPSVLSVEEAES